MAVLSLKLAALASAMVSPGTQPARADQAIVTRQLVQCFDKQAAIAEFSGVVLARRGDEEFVRAAGTADPQGKVPIGRDTSFRLASVQKVLTRVAIGLLADRGLLRLDDPVGKYVDGLPLVMASATIDQLVQHRSGVAPLTRLTPETGARILNATTTSELVETVASQSMSFRPGERQEYSNGGYFLLGAVIEKASGLSYGSFLEQAIFKPLDMRSSRLVADSRTAVPISRIAEGGNAPVAPTDRPGTAAGNGVSNADDLATLGSALIDGRLLSEPTRQLMFPRQPGEWRIGQDGGSFGVNTSLAAFPDSGWVLVVLSNFDPPAGELMSEALRGVIAGKGCVPLSEKDRPSRLRRMPPPRT